MGVLGLWQILESVGHPIKIEALEGKRLGVDANVWLYKFIRGFREKDNASNIDSHKLGLFNRISKLLFYKIKPVFVFDGPAPVLKRRTLERRQNIRNKQLEKVQSTAMKLLAEQLKEQYPDANLDEIRIQLPELRSNNLVAAEKLTDEDFELFYLPPEVREVNESDEESLPETPHNVPVKQENLVYHIDSDDEEVVKPDIKPSIDINSAEFVSLPAEIRYEILQDIKETKRRIRRTDALPEDAGTFSSFQLERLKARRSIQEKIENCEKEICSMFTGDCDGRAVQSYRMQSDSTSTMLYLKNSTQRPDDSPLLPQTQVDNESKSDPQISTEQSSRTIRNPALKPLLDSTIKDIKTPAVNLIRVRAAIKGNSTINLSAADESGPALSESSDNNSDTDEDVQHVEPRNSTVKSNESEFNPANPHVDNLDPTDKHEQEPSSQVENDSFSESNDEQPHDSKKQETTINLIESDDEISMLEPQTSVNKNLNETNFSVEICYETLQKSPKSEPPVEKIETISDSPDDTFLETHQPEPTQKQVGNELDSEDVRSSPKPNAPLEGEPTVSTSSKAQANQTEFRNIAELREAKSNSTRLTNKVTTKIVEEAKELLRLFGIPYIDATGEAEAQCALLERLKLTEGTITDDSDVWLFGAQVVYRYFFSDDKYVMQYKMPDIEYHVRMTRENLVCFAMLVGSDYTDGIMNVGPVTALEILSEFPGDGMVPLVKFRDWKSKYAASKGRIPGSKKREKLLKFNLPEEFPSRAVFDGYMRPVADASTEQFAWGTPELDELREYARRNFGWDMKKIDDKLLPVMKKLSERKTQTTIDSYFFKTAANQNPELFRSKRVNEALSKIAKTAENDGVVLTEDEDESGVTEAEEAHASKTKRKAVKKSVGKVTSKKSSQSTSAARKRRKVKSK